MPIEALVLDTAVRSQTNLSIKKPEARDILGLEHKLHSQFERAMEYVKDRTESFVDYYPYIKEDCNLKYVYNWIGLFVFLYNAIRASIKFRQLIHLIGGDNA